ncbi:CBS domain-containing protein [Desulfocicer vacuolatum DSM 3385]|uniref:CBS domain-containing protein n=1 Tax=Desulfocicer vacuolatum DSM 3385 TaxID=1121400 RepID=A0A1W2DI32_9BACT|nr:CBS domain-containing protein [Desulfocicer vacuolatum]SMC96722.1 CBS domain-containing protein [Desulfocicer vacuolatum DSM 3385]
MKITAKDIMSTQFHTLTSHMGVHQAVKLFKQASRAEGRKVFGMMVIDDSGGLAGILSMYDILLFMRPKHIHIWGMIDDIDIVGLVEQASEKTKSVLVGDIMTPDVITVTPDTHKLMILDIMIKKHVRRLPVVDNGKIQGIVYISDLFYDVLDRFMD